MTPSCRHRHSHPHRDASMPSAFVPTVVAAAAAADAIADHAGARPDRRPGRPAATSGECRDACSRDASRGNANSGADHRPGRLVAAEEPDGEGDRQGEAGREVGLRHFQPRAMPAAEGRIEVDGIAAACRGQAGLGPARGDRRLRLVLDRGLRLEFTRVHLSQSPRDAAAPAISGRRHHGPQSRQGRR